MESVKKTVETTVETDVHAPDPADRYDVDKQPVEVEETVEETTVTEVSRDV